MGLASCFGGTPLGPASLAVALAVAPVALGADETPPWTAYTSPQQLVRLPDGRRINVVCMGHGSPVVILESGGGAATGAWAYVQHTMARTTRTCAYDRAGLGFSDEGPAPRDATAAAADLAAMLQAAKLEGPYVLVGHSFGGYVVRLFAELHAGQVAGMVLIDPPVEGMAERVRAISPAIGEIQDEGRRAQEKATTRCMAAAGAGELKPGSDAYWTCVPGPLPDLPAELTLAFLAPYTSPAFFRTAASEVASLDRSAAELAAHPRSLGDRPLIVLTADAEPKEPHLTDAENQAAEKLRIQVYDELAALSSRGQNHVVPGAHHYIQRDKPQVVVDAVDEMVADARRPSDTGGR